MRVTPADNRPDFNYHVFIDGTEVLNCVMADDEKGEVEAYKMRNGGFIIEDGEIKTFKQSGKIVIEKRPWPRARDYGSMICG